VTIIVAGRPMVSTASEKKERDVECRHP